MSLAPQYSLVHVEPVQGVGQHLPHVLRNGYGAGEADFATELSKQLLIIRKSGGFLIGTEFHYLARIPSCKI